MVACQSQLPTAPCHRIHCRTLPRLAQMHLRSSFRVFASQRKSAPPHNVILCSLMGSFLEDSEAGINIINDTTSILWPNSPFSIPDALRFGASGKLPFVFHAHRCGPPALWEFVTERSICAKCHVTAI